MDFAYGLITGVVLVIVISYANAIGSDKKNK